MSDLKSDTHKATAIVIAVIYGRTTRLLPVLTPPPSWYGDCLRRQSRLTFFG